MTDREQIIIISSLPVRLAVTSNDPQLPYLLSAHCRQRQTGKDSDMSVKSRKQQGEERWKTGESNPPLVGTNQKKESCEGRGEERKGD